MKTNVYQIDTGSGFHQDRYVYIIASSTEAAVERFNALVKDTRIEGVRLECEALF